MEFKLTVAAGPEPGEAFAQLVDWLGAEEELRGQLRTESLPPRPGHLGLLDDVLVAAVGSGGAITVLISSIKTFLNRPRHADVKMLIERPDGVRIEFDAKRVGDAEEFLRRALEQ